MTIITVENKQFCTRCLKHFNKQRTLQQHQWYCKNKVEPGNLIDDLRSTGGYSKEVRKARYDCVRRLLQKLVAQKKYISVNIILHQIYYYLNIYYKTYT